MIILFLLSLGTTKVTSSPQNGKTQLFLECEKIFKKTFVKQKGGRGGRRKKKREKKYLCKNFGKIGFSGTKI